MFAQIGLIVLLSGSPQVQYDPEEAMLAQQFDGAVSNTRYCIHQLQKGMLMNGARDRKYLTSYPAFACGIALKQFMTHDLKRPEKEVNAFLIAMSGEQLNIVLSESR